MELETTLRSFLSDENFGDEMWDFAVVCWLAENPDLPRRAIKRFHHDARALTAYLAKSRREAQIGWLRQREHGASL